MPGRNTRVTTTRRRLLQHLALIPAATLTGTPAWAEAAATGIGLITPAVCLVTPEATEGPYYIDPKLVRADITEGKTGVGLDMALQVVSADCTPVKNARVDLWHCDAAGNYSGFGQQGSDEVSDTSKQTFLRGTQFTGETGVCAFQTIFPGWYRGRTTHLHYKVFLDDRTVLTSQIFLPDGLSQFIYEKIAPYNERPNTRDVFNSNDGIAQDAGDGAHAAIRELGERYAAALVVGIKP